MPTFLQQILILSHPIDSQVGVGDIVWYIPSALLSTPDGSLIYDVKVGDLNNVTKFGNIQSISGLYQNPSVVVTYDDNISIPAVTDYIFFSKDERVNKSDIKGYYASVKLKNNSKEKAELFALSANIEESSK